MNTTVIIASTLGLLLVTLVLVSILLYAKSKLVPSGPVKISINNEKDLSEDNAKKLKSFYDDFVARFSKK